MTTRQPNRCDSSGFRGSGNAAREFASEFGGARDAETRVEVDSWHPNRVREQYFGYGPSRRAPTPLLCETDRSARQSRRADRVYKLGGIVALLGLIALIALTG